MLVSLPEWSTDWRVGATYDEQHTFLDPPEGEPITLACLGTPTALQPCLKKRTCHVALTFLFTYQFLL